MSAQSRHLDKLLHRRVVDVVIRQSASAWLIYPANVLDSTIIAEHPSKAAVLTWIREQNDSSQTTRYRVKS